MAKKATLQRPLSETLRLPAGPVDVTALPTNAAPGYPGKGKADAQQLLQETSERVSALQEQLYANGREGTGPSLLVLLQGMDTAGKGGTVRHAFSMMDPSGIRHTAFKAPSAEERKHDFLWRIKNACPLPGEVGIFDRSQYEDVLVVRVDKLVPVSEWKKRYEQINEFEESLIAGGTTVVKCFLNVSKAEQKKRLAARLEDPTKYWKYNPSDLVTRSKWDEYMQAYGDALEKCNTEAAPWYVVPADKKWYRNWAVSRLILEHLEGMELTWPPATFDVAEQQQAVAKA